VGERDEPGRQLDDAVAVAHPHVELVAATEPLEDARGPLDLDGRRAVLAVGCLLHAATEQPAEQLHAVADAEHRHSELEHTSVDRG
jgi:hypothetical protein